MTNYHELSLFLEVLTPVEKVKLTTKILKMVVKIARKEIDKIETKKKKKKKKKS